MSSIQNKLVTPFTVLVIVLISLILFCGCSSKQQKQHVDTISKTYTSLSTLGYSIQVGAFANINNALRLSKKLSGQGLDAYYFKENTLYKVRFGNYKTFKETVIYAKALVRKSIIDDYYIISPGSYAINRFHPESNIIRNKLVETAKSFIGVPYKWGGESVEEGFDCSGLSMVVYKLNGFDLPRTSRDQFTKGKLVKRQDLQAGDLVFFDTRNKGYISHVGIYKGNNQFIHAPRRGKKIKTANLNSNYFKKRYVGAKTFIF